MTVSTKHPVWTAIRPLLEAVGGDVVDAGKLIPGDVPITWDGRLIGGVRLDSLSSALDRLVSHIEEELGGKLIDLSRTEKQAAVRLLDERGAFLLRKAIEDVAAMMGVSRITIYNYLNVIRNDLDRKSKRVDILLATDDATDVASVSGPKGDASV
jgi:hypothetical protein